MPPLPVEVVAVALESADTASPAPTSIQRGTPTTLELRLRSEVRLAVAPQVRAPAGVTVKTTARDDSGRIRLEVVADETAPEQVSLQVVIAGADGRPDTMLASWELNVEAPPPPPPPKAPPPAPPAPAPGVTSRPHSAFAHALVPPLLGLQDIRSQGHAVHAAATLLGPEAPRRIWRVSAGLRLRLHQGLHASIEQVSDAALGGEAAEARGDRDFLVGAQWRQVLPNAWAWALRVQAWLPTGRDPGSVGTPLLRPALSASLRMKWLELRVLQGASVGVADDAPRVWSPAAGLDVLLPRGLSLGTEGQLALGRQASERHSGGALGVLLGVSVRQAFIQFATRAQFGATERQFGRWATTLSVSLQPSDEAR